MSEFRSHFSIAEAEAYARTGRIIKAGAALTLAGVLTAASIRSNDGSSSSCKPEEYLNGHARITVAGGLNVRSAPEIAAGNTLGVDTITAINGQDLHGAKTVDIVYPRVTNKGSNSATREYNKGRWIDFWARVKLFGFLPKSHSTDAHVMDSFDTDEFVQIQIGKPETFTVNCGPNGEKIIPHGISATVGDLEKTTVLPSSK